MTEILLIIIMLMLSVDIFLTDNILHGKSDERNYDSCEVEYHCDICTDDIFAVAEKAKELGKDNWVLASVIPTDVSGNNCYALFFTRKKIKNYRKKS